ncbi:MAG: hypothetical protein AAF623_18255 [Planctomycetota bacterium]
MRQLGELYKQAKKFEQAEADVIVIFREESQGVEGLKKIRSNTKTKFKLALDFQKKQTSRFSTGRREFSSYVVDKDGVIQKIVTGDLKNRAKSNQLLSALKRLSTGSKQGPSSKSGSGSKASKGSGKK